MLEPEVIRRIRHIFLQPRPHVSIWQATDLLGWTRGEMNDAIAAGDVELMTTPPGKRFWRAEVMAEDLLTWALHGIHAAVRGRVEGVPAAWRPAPGGGGPAPWPDIGTAGACA